MALWGGGKTGYNIPTADELDKHLATKLRQRSACAGSDQTSVGGFHYNTITYQIKNPFCQAPELPEEVKAWGSSLTGNVFKDLLMNLGRLDMNNPTLGKLDEVHRRGVCDALLIHALRYARLDLGILLKKDTPPMGHINLAQASWAIKASTISIEDCQELNQILTGVEFSWASNALMYASCQDPSPLGDSFCSKYPRPPRPQANPFQTVARRPGAHNLMVAPARTTPLTSSTASPGESAGDPSRPQESLRSHFSLGVSPGQIGRAHV